MQYVRSISGSVSKTWNSINPATLSGAIDVIVLEQEDGSLACSPFHVRFGKFSLLRPYEKKVEFRVNDVKQNFAMKLGEGGEAFFVFETADEIPEGLQTSPLVSPAVSPNNPPSGQKLPSVLQEPEFLDLSTVSAAQDPSRAPEPGMLQTKGRSHTDLGNLTPLSRSPDDSSMRPGSGDWSEMPEKRLGYGRSVSNEDMLLPQGRNFLNSRSDSNLPQVLPIITSEPRTSSDDANASHPERANSPPPVPTEKAVIRAKSLSHKLTVSNIPTHVTESGDLMLDMTGYKSSDDEALRAEIVARKILSEELDGNYDIGALIGADAQGNLWIYSSEEAKEAAGRRAGYQQYPSASIITSDSASDPGYQSESEKLPAVSALEGQERRRPSDAADNVIMTPPQTPPEDGAAGDPNRNYAKTLRLTSDQLKALGLKPGPNSMSFSVNRATCQANMFYWKHDIPIVVSDIDGTITKSDALGHVLNMIGRDWTHLGVAKLYTDIVANGYHIMYLTSRSVGQADTTRNYLSGVVQDSYKLPVGPVIMSPDRTIAALRREIYLRKPEVFKMACLRDIQNLFNLSQNPFYAGFGNRLTDALSYRSVNIPRTRIFTINSNAEVSLDLLTLNKYKSSYVSMRELVDHFFPPISLLVKGGGEEYTDFNYWREPLLEIDDFSASDSEDDDNARGSVRSEDEGSDGLGEGEEGDDMGESFLSRESMDDGGEMVDSMLEGSAAEDESAISEPPIQGNEELAEAEAHTLDFEGPLNAAVDLSPKGNFAYGGNNMPMGQSNKDASLQKPTKGLALALVEDASYGSTQPTTLKH